LLKVMAETESAVVAAPVEKSPETGAKEERVAKVDKPDEEKFKKELAEAEKQISAVTEKIVCSNQHQEWLLIARLH
jgi:flagellar biosynthesis/type III secretory pathway chaperone